MRETCGVPSRGGWGLSHGGFLWCTLRCTLRSMIFSSDDEYVYNTVQYGAIEIGFWRAGSSFLKLVVKSGQVGSSFLKNRNPPPRNFASPPLRRRTTRVQRGDVPMHLHQPMGHSEQSKQAWHPTALYHTASGELSGDPSIPPVISPPCLTSWSVRRISCDMWGGVRRRGSFRNWLSLV